MGGKTARGRSLLSCGVTGCLDFGMDGQTQGRDQTGPRRDQKIITQVDALKFVLITWEGLVILCSDDFSSTTMFLPLLIISNNHFKLCWRCNLKLYQSKTKQYETNLSSKNTRTNIYNLVLQTKEKGREQFHSIESNHTLEHSPFVNFATARQKLQRGARTISFTFCCYVSRRPLSLLPACIYPLQCNEHQDHSYIL